MLDTDALLTSIISRISSENLRAEEIRLEGRSGAKNDSDELLAESSRFITGLMFLTGKLLETFDSSNED
jgi:hypothetical protein